MSLPHGLPGRSSDDQARDDGGSASDSRRLVLPGYAGRFVVRSRRPGARPDRLRWVRRPLFRRHGEQVLVATERTLAPRSRAGKLLAPVRRAVMGPPLASAEEAGERLTRIKALAVLSSDAISSVAYGPEAALGILIAAGTVALGDILPIAVVIALLMVIVGFSYRQTIHAYPHGGGSYIVARDNLGVTPGLIAAAALLIDYVLTVSVSVASGVDALASALPALLPFIVPIGVVFIVLIVLVNLRGIRDSGTIFAAPTYLFIVALLAVAVAGFVHAALSPGGLLHAIPPAARPSALGWHESAALTPLLILTAFASGCSAMTGVEAISNGVPAFRPPEAKHAARTLEWMIATLVVLFLATAYLAWRYGIEPYAGGRPTVVAQITRLLFVGPFAWGFYVVQAATLLILVLAANTSFADFPRLSAILARDGFMPHQFATRGNRLAFSTGIVILGALSMVLLVVFDGNVDALINLYALGVFTAFTLSQSGMVVHWWRLGHGRPAAPQGGTAEGAHAAAAPQHWRRSLGVNLVGACATGLVALVILITKFDRGAWIVVALVPLLVLLFRAIAADYHRTHERLAPEVPLAAEAQRHGTHIMVVPFAELNRPAVQALAYACSLAPHVIALHVALSLDDEGSCRAAWDRWIDNAVPARGGVRTPFAAANAPHVLHVPQRPLHAIPRLVIIESPYRSLTRPLVAYVNALRDANPGATITAVIPEFVPAHWWERLLHYQAALRLKLALYRDPGVAVLNIPYMLRGRPVQPHPHPHPHPHSA